MQVTDHMLILIFYMPACLDSTVGDGRLGYPDKAPYDAIHVGAAAAVVPEAVS